MNGEADDGVVLVTGGAGFIGHHLVAALIARGRRVRVLDDLSTGRRERLPESPDVEFVHASVLDGAAVAAAVRDVSAVHHLAGLVGVRLASREARRAHDTAVEGTRTVLERLPGSARMLFYSSSAVYGLDAVDPAREATPLHEAAAREYDAGVEGYATGKLRAERLVDSAAAAGRLVATVRPFNVVGERQSSTYGMVLPTFVARALRGEPLLVHDDGAQTRSFSDVGVFVDAVLALADSRAAFARERHVFNCGAPRPTSILELARAVRRVVGRDVPIEFVPYADVYPGRRDVRARVPDVTRLEQIVGPLRWPAPERTIERCVAACTEDAARTR